MKLVCKRCNLDEVFEIPDFSSEEKQQLLDMNTSSSLLAIQKIKTLHNISFSNAKFIVLHLTKEVTKCHRCKTELDQQEYVSCSKCNSLNFNWNVNS